MWCNVKYRAKYCPRISDVETNKCTCIRMGKLTNVTLLDDVCHFDAFLDSPTWRSADRVGLTLCTRQSRLVSYKSGGSAWGKMFRIPHAISPQGQHERREICFKIGGVTNTAYGISSEPFLVIPLRASTRLRSCNDLNEHVSSVWFTRPATNGEKLKYC